MALSEEDSLLPAGVISNKIKAELGTDTVWGAISSLYKGGKPFIASLSRIVFDAYAEGDEAAIEIIDQNAKRLAELLNIGVQAHRALPKAVASGGIFEHHTDIMLKHLAKYTDVEIVISTLPPIYGACRQAHKLIGECEPTEFLNNFKESYKGE